MASPMHADGSLDLEGAQRLAHHLVGQGSDGLVVAGTTGESPTLSHGETLELFRAVVEAVGDRTTVIAGTGKNDTRATVELTREAERIGVDAALVVSPYYNRPSQRGLRHHFSQVAGATGLPILLYNIPSRTGCEIAPETLLDLATSVPNIRGVKDAVCDMEKAAWLAVRKPEDFDILSGDDVSTLPLLAVGAVGVVSVAGHLVGDQMAAMVEVFATDPGKAREIHFQLLPLLSALMTVDTSPAPLKAALRLVGLPGGPVRSPLVDCDEEAVAAVRAAMEAAGVAPR